jgi:cell wall-associated NlpC family hydrolase
MNAADIVTAARGWVGTPFHHQGRVRGVGCDCIGLVIGVAKELGILDYDYTGYGRIPNPLVFGRELAANLDRTDRPEPGTVLWFAFNSAPQHVGIVTDTGLIHAYAVAGRVVETGLDPQWITRCRGMFKFRGVDY